MLNCLMAGDKSEEAEPDGIVAQLEETTPLSCVSTHYLPLLFFSLFFFRIIFIYKSSCIDWEHKAAS